MLLTCTTLSITAIAQTTAKKPVVKKVAVKKAVQPKGPKPILLPDFFSYAKRVDGDTSYTYEVRDANGNTIPVDNIRDQSQIHAIIYYKSYYKFPPKPGSPMSPPYLSMRQYAYEYQGEGLWLGYNALTNEHEEFKGDMKKIVKTDTHPSNAPQNHGETVTHKYYKTVRSGGANPAQTHTHSH